MTTLDGKTPEDIEREMSSLDESRAPSVSKQTRTAAYFATLVVGAATVLTVGVVGAWWPDYLDRVSATMTALSGAVSVIGGGLGVVYRPTRL